MKFEDSSLTRYLVKNLESLTEADPAILAEYVVALLKKDKPIEELQKLCAEKLFEFLGQGTNSFIKNLFQVLENDSVVAPAKSLDATRQVEPSPSLITENPDELKSSSLKREVPASTSDPDEKEVSDDDDGDRNHKHRRRESRSQSFDKDAHGQFVKRTNRKRNKPSENGQEFFGNDPQSSDNQNEYSPASLERDFSGRIDRRRLGLAPLPRTAYDMGPRARINQAFHGDPGLHFDLSTSLGRIPMGRGRGRGSFPWNHHDMKFSSMETLDFASQMAPLGHTPTSLFAGRGLQPFGIIQGIPNGGLDTLHPLGLQGALGPQINQPIGIGMPHQRCRDFEERGFCLRGDMCPMEHGVNRIVVEDVQSLSQFNLPVSLSSTHLLGPTPGSGSLHLGGGSSSFQTKTKVLHSNNNNNKHGSAGEADLYDPDQPLWNNSHLSSPKADDAEPSWNGDPSDRHGFKLSDGFEVENPDRSIGTTVSSQSTSSSVWGRIRNSENNSDKSGNFDTTVASMGGLKNETKDQEDSIIPASTRQRKRFASEDAGPKATKFAANPKLRSEPARRSGRTLQKALRTLFVNAIPLNINKKETLLSHFRKFGQVVDIYIPLNSERAFIQFSKREEAEAALKAPDAVMGNRFIKLWWANRDSIPDNGLSVGNNASTAPQGANASIFPQPPTADRKRESLSPAVPVVSAVPLSDLPVSTAAVCPSATNSPKVTPPQKKQDNLGLLKEELRLKQEMLDKKRSDFRRQLDMLEKKAMTVKGEATTEHSAKRHQAGTGTRLLKIPAPSPVTSITVGSQPDIVKTSEISHPVESNVSPNSKASSTLMLHSPKSLKLRSSVSLGAVSVAKRFKLDNRPTTFKILPPLPADFANVVVIKEHFSTYGDISSIELEDLEADSGDQCSEPSVIRAAFLTFTTRRSAEIAFLSGKCWKGHNLKFSWVVGHSCSSNNHSGRENSPTLTPKNASDTELVAETAVSGSLSVAGEEIRSVSKVVASTANKDVEDSKGVQDSTVTRDLVCRSSRTTLPLCQTVSSKDDTPNAEDGICVESVQ